MIRYYDIVMERLERHTGQSIRDSVVVKRGIGDSCSISHFGFEALGFNHFRLMDYGLWLQHFAECSAHQNPYRIMNF